MDSMCFVQMPEEVLLHFCPKEWEYIQFLDYCVAFVILDNGQNP
jgi:hypothetical protein